MKELGRFVGYTIATLVMIGVVIGIAKVDTGGNGVLATSAIVVVVVLPVIIAIFMGKREKRNETS